MPITALPTPPSRSDPANFSNRADTFLGALPTFGIEANELQVDVNARQTAALNNAAAAAASATASNNSASAAAASAAAASATAGVTAWSAATNYTLGQNAFDTTNFLTYRRRVAGTTATRPGLDPTNWELISGNVTTNTDQTITGVKTFASAPVVPDDAFTFAKLQNIATATILGRRTAGTGDVEELTGAQASQVVGGNPAGTVIYVAMNAAPTGYIKANGAAIGRTTFAPLFAAIGTTFGAGDGTTTFNVPDLRGEFIRGWDDGRGVDSGRVFGSAQAGEIQSHAHAIDADSGSVNGDGIAGTANGAFYRNFTTTATGGTETRPRNIALLACIKF